MRESRRSGFTLIELLVVIAIIAILAAILFPVFTAVRKKGQGAACMSNLRQIAMAFKDYQADASSTFMPAAGYSNALHPWWGKAFPYLLRPYIKNQRIFYCPAASKRDKDFKGLFDEDNPNAADCGWIWGDDPNNPSKSHYGNNIALGGGDVVKLNAGQPTPWGPFVPNEAMVREPTKIIYVTDSRWVDLYGGWHPGRIGMAKERHPGGANAVCCDAHCKWLPVNLANKWKIITDPKEIQGDNPRWDYR